MENAVRGRSVHHGNNYCWIHLISTQRVLKSPKVTVSTCVAVIFQAQEEKAFSFCFSTPGRIQNDSVSRPRRAALC